MYQIDNIGELIDVTSKCDICRDFHDNFLWSLSIDGNADFLITGDADLLDLGKIDQTIILTWQKFLTNLG